MMRPPPTPNRPADNPASAPVNKYKKKKLLMPLVCGYDGMAVNGSECICVVMLLHAGLQSFRNSGNQSRLHRPESH